MAIVQPRNTDVLHEDKRRGRRAQNGYIRIKRRLRAVTWRSIRLEVGKDNKFCLDPWHSEWLERKTPGTVNHP